MALEIYYTSAPEGLRPGDRGFCTVAATAGIPRNLWDRLEAMSGYRHLPDSTRQKSPVSLAHWLLHLDGRDHHVLSRVCDAGRDYSQRTNSLAHHLVLETSELAAGGPAWMLSQHGVMLENWDGRVGAIERAVSLPSGDQPPRPCHAWQQMTGDAGWAGVVAETIAKMPWKPICLIFDQDQSLLELIGEAVALLPVGQRWQATFNTYFTSLPGGVSCQWRCCLANTPAAGAAVRAAGNGLVIDLCNPAGLGNPPGSAWVDAARSGRAMVAARASPAVKPATAPAPVRPVPPVPPPPMMDRPPVEPIPLRMEPAIPIPEPGAPVIIPRRSTATQPIWNLDRAAPLPEVSWLAERRRQRQRRLMIIYGLALAAIVVGLWFEILAYHSTAPQPVRPSGPTPQTPPPRQAIVVPTPPPSVTSRPVETRPSPVPTPPQPTSLPTVVIVPPTRPAVVVRPPPVAILLNDYLPAPGSVTGVRDATHSVDIPRDKLDDPDNIAALTLSLPGNSGEKWAFKHDDLDGHFTVKSDGTKQQPGATLFWRDRAGVGAPAKVASVTLDKTHWQLVISFSAALMLRQPHVANAGYWALQDSTLMLADAANARPQPVHFAGFTGTPLRLLDAKTNVSFPVDWPAAVKISLGKTDPDGWRQTGDAADPTVLHLEKPAGQDVAAPAFTVRFNAASGQLENDFVRKEEAAISDLKASETDLKHVDDDIQQQKDYFQRGINAAEDMIKEWTVRQKQQAENPQASIWTAEDIQKALDKQTKLLAERTAALETGLAPLNTKRAAGVADVAAKRAALAAFTNLKEVDVTVELPQGLQAGTLRLVHQGD